MTDAGPSVSRGTLGPTTAGWWAIDPADLPGGLAEMTHPDRSHGSADSVVPAVLALNHRAARPCVPATRSSPRRVPA
jgi:hypothetical protein